MNHVSVKDWKGQEKNTLRGFFTLQFGALEIRDCTLHEKDGKRWFGFPGRKWEKGDGSSQWVAVCVVGDREFRERLQAHVCGLLAQEVVS